MERGLVLFEELRVVEELDEGSRGLEGHWLSLSSGASTGCKGVGSVVQHLLSEVVGLSVGLDPEVA